MKNTKDRTRKARTRGGCRKGAKLTVTKGHVTIGDLLSGLTPDKVKGDFERNRHLIADKARSQSIEDTAENLLATCQYYYDKGESKKEVMKCYDFLYEEVVKALPDSEPACREALWTAIVEVGPVWFPRSRSQRTKYRELYFGPPEEFEH
jgi:hypothetical protein